MKKLLAILFFAMFMVATTTPMLSNVMGFGPAIAHAGDNDDQGDDNDDQ